MKRIAALILFACMTAKARAFAPFVVSDIRIDGLERISPGTVFSYLPVEKGETLTDENAKQAIRALFHTGFFSDVELDRQGDILVVKVAERPAISSLTLRGNKDIKSDDLKKGLKEIGLSEGSTFDRLALDRVRQELIRQYYNRGKYNVAVEPHVTRLDRNRVAIDIEIREGKAARIKQINIVGNKAFPDDDIRKDFESGTTNLLSWYTQNDQYSREKLSGDLEKLQSYYQDRGYADFDIDSTEVAISPNKSSMYVTTNISEGDVYTISDIKLLGDLILPEKTIRQLVLLKPGDTFSRKKLEYTSDAITALLSNIGYAFAEVTPIPKLDKEKRTAEVTFYVKPGQRVYVRRINFSGNTRTEDQVLRREMRQFEGGWYSQAAIDRSKIRLQRLGYFKTVDIEKQRVPGTPDQVDVNVKVEEQTSGSLLFGLGYSQVAGIIGSFSVSQNNFLGTGDRFSAAVQQSSYLKNYELSYVDPYFTDNGVSLGYNASYKELDQGEANIANYLFSTKSLGTTVGVPVSETDTVNLGFAISSNRINTFPGVTPQVLIDYITDLGHRTDHAWTTSLSYAHDTRNAYFAPTRGGLQYLSAEVALPGSTVEYYKLYLQSNHYFPLPAGFVLFLNGNVGYGETYGKDKERDFPFWQNFYAGGVRDVRGFEDNTLGPRVGINDVSRPQPIGGAFKVLGSSQVFIPIPLLKDVNTARVSAFVDVGNVYKDFDAFNTADLRASVGLSLQWQAPIGPIIINLAKPVRYKPEDKQFFEKIQFTFGPQF